MSTPPQTPADSPTLNAARRSRELDALATADAPVDLIVIGGGVSKKADKYLPLLDLRTPIVPATLRNDAGIIGAAWMAAQKSARPTG